MKGRMFKDVLVQPGSKTMGFLEAGKVKEAEKLVKCCRRMCEANYDYAVVQQVRRENPDLF